MTVPEGSRFVLAPEVVVQPLEDGGAVLVATGQETYFSLSPSARVIVDALRGGKDVAGAAAALQQEFEVDPVTAEADVRSLLGDLLGERLVQPVPDPPASR